MKSAKAVVCNPWHELPRGMSVKRYVTLDGHAGAHVTSLHDATRTDDRDVGGQPRMFTARATTRIASTSETEDSMVMANFAHLESGMTSVGLNAVAFVNDV